MAGVLASIVGRNGRQSAQLNLSTQGINDPQYVFQSQSGLACFKIDDEAHTNPSCQRQLGLRETELFASGTQCIAECWGDRMDVMACSVSRSGNYHLQPH